MSAKQDALVQARVTVGYADDEIDRRQALLDATPTSATLKLNRNVAQNVRRAVRIVRDLLDQIEEA